MRSASILRFFFSAFPALFLACSPSASNQNAVDGARPPPGSASGEFTLGTPSVDLLRGGTAHIAFSAKDAPAGSVLHALDLPDAVMAEDAPATASDLVLQASVSAPLGEIDATLALVAPDGTQLGVKTVHVDVRLPPGSLDETFGDAGSYVVEMSNTSGIYKEIAADFVAPLAGGGWYVLAHETHGSRDPATDVYTATSYSFAHVLDASGKLLREVDAPINGAATLRGVVQPQSGGMLFQRLYDGETPDGRTLVRLDATGNVDAAFGIKQLPVTVANAANTFSNAAPVALPNDGLLAFSPDRQIIELTASAVFDTSFGIGGTTPALDASFTREGTATAVPLADGKILVVVGVSSYDVLANHAAPSLWFWRYDARGVLDRTFGVAGLVKTNSPLGFEHVAIDRQGRIVIEGDHAFARFAADGSVDPTFGTNGRAGPTEHLGGYREAAWMMLDDRDRILALWGDSNGLVGDVARLTADGAPDPSFKTAHPIPTGSYVRSPGRKLIVAGKAPKSFFRNDGANVTETVLIVQRLFL